ncbi:Protein phosphatase 1 regulatory subunit 27 [Stylophora pistillata]|uniref:Protein phosphatase 1 regulatory subunit 27 n=1 Tax=Stylophora pistillata TaxID=50429 RepID=A0A2B4SCJ8_STYPI|nr:Protein phosphatase 1 regulatory subunit 27 [Stylophora pistillata]
MASDEKILDELHFLSWKIDTLERKLESSMSIQRDLTVSLLQEDSSFAGSVSPFKKFERRKFSGSSCSEAVSSDDEHNSSHLDGTNFSVPEKEPERSTSYLIIPVGRYKDNDSCSISTEKQTFRWSEMDDNACKYFTSDDALNGDKDGDSKGKLDVNARDLNACDTPKSFANQNYLQFYNSEKFKSNFSTGEVEEKRAEVQQLRPLFEESTTQSSHSSNETTFDQIYNHPPESTDCNKVNYKQSSFDFTSEIDVCNPEKESNPSFNVICIDSESSEVDDRNCDFVDVVRRASLSCQENLDTSNANWVEGFEQPSSANIDPEKKQAMPVYSLPVKNKNSEMDVYLPQQMEPLSNGNRRLQQGKLNCNATASNKVIEMQIGGSPDEQRHEHSYCARKPFEVETLLTNNGANKQNDSTRSSTHNQGIPRNVNNYGDSSREALKRVNRTKPSQRAVDGLISQFEDQAYCIVGYSNDYKLINTDSIRRTAVHKPKTKIYPVPPSYEQVIEERVRILTRGPRAHLGQELFQNYLQTEGKSYVDGTQTKFRFGSESRSSEPSMSAISDDVFFDSAPDPISVNQTSSKNHSATYDVSESDSCFSSITSVSSTNEGIYPWKIRNDSLSRDHEHDKKIISRQPQDSLSITKQLSSTRSYQRDSDSSSDSESCVRGFKLSPLSRSLRAQSLQEELVQRIVPPREFIRGHDRVSSPTSSLDTSELSMNDSVCGCLYQCECQTGIPSAEDFRDELKAISTCVLKARIESASLYKKPPVKYFLDEEQGEMDIFHGRLQKKESKNVPVLVRVILRLRKHFFGTLESKSAHDNKTRSDANNNEFNPVGKIGDQTSGRKQRDRKITFSPSAMLLSAIGENSAAEVKEVIERERIDVNQLSPSGRSLLHKAAAAGDLESIHTLIQYGAMVNIIDQDGFPPIHSALKKAHFKCAILLIEYGTDVTRYTTERIREFLEIKEMSLGHLPVLLKTTL